MASTYSTNLGIELMGTGDQSGTWGSTTNTNLGTLLEQAIAGYSTQAVADSASPTVLTIANGASSTGRNAVIALTGALTAARVVEVPAKTKSYIFYNATTGGFAVTVKVTGQTGVSIPNGSKAIVYCDSTDVRNVLSNITVDASNGNVGIGTTSPGYKLTTVGASAAGGIYTATSNTDATAGSLAGYLGIANGTNNYFALFQAVGGATTFSNAGAAGLTIQTAQAQPLIFSTTAAERMRIDSSGNVGIGSSSPTAKLEVLSSSFNIVRSISSGGYAAFQRYAPTGQQVYDFYTINGVEVARITGDPSYLAFCTGSSAAERMRIDSSGNVGIGTTTFNGVKTVVQGAQTGGAPQTSGTTQTYGLLRLKGTTFTSVLDFGTNGGTYNWIQATDSANLATNYDLAIQPNGGNLLVGTTTVLNYARVTVVNANPQIVARHSGATAGKYWNSPYIDPSNQFYIINQDNVGVYLTDGATAWAANSDERLKDIIAPITSALEGVQSLRAVKYSWKSDADKVAHIGLIAQDVQKVLPEVVASAKLPLSEDETKYLSVAYTEVIPLLVAAIQELSAKVTALESR
jgi:hypothetical protein